VTPLVIAAARGSKLRSGGTPPDVAVPGGWGQTVAPSRAFVGREALATFGAAADYVVWIAKIRSATPTTPRLWVPLPYPILGIDDFARHARERVGSGS